VPAFVSSFIPAAGDTLDRGDRDAVIELWQVLSTLVDPRDRRGVRDDLATVLTLAVAGVAAGARSLVAIAAWAQDLPRGYWSRFRVRRRTPCAATFARVLARVDPDVLDALLGAWTTAAAGDLAAQTAIAVDGKSARGARRPDGSRVHLFAAITHGTAIPLGQIAAPTKGYEIATFATLLDRVALHGRVITAYSPGLEPLFSFGLSRRSRVVSTLTRSDATERARTAIGTRYGPPGCRSDRIDRHSRTGRPHAACRARAVLTAEPQTHRRPASRAQTRHR